MYIQVIAKEKFFTFQESIQQEFMHDIGLEKIRIYNKKMIYKYGNNVMLIIIPLSLIFLLFLVIDQDE